MATGILIGGVETVDRRVKSHMVDLQDSWEGIMMLGDQMERLIF